MVAVPAPIPFTTPLPSTTATPWSLVSQDPPGVPLVSKLMVELTHTDPGPLIVPAVTWGLTVTFTDSVAPPQLLGTE